MGWPPCEPLVVGGLALLCCVSAALGLFFIREKKRRRGREDNPAPAQVAGARFRTAIPLSAGALGLLGHHRAVR